VNDWRDNLNRSIFPYVEYEGYPDKYPTLEPIYLSEEFCDDLRNTSEKLYGIMAKTTSYFQKCPEQWMADMEIPEKLIPYMNIPNKLGLPTWLSRFDFIVTPLGEIKLIELNADTPCAWVEAYYGNDVASEAFGRPDTNEGELSHLQRFLNNIDEKTYMPAYNIKNGMFMGEGAFGFACFEDYTEDYGNTLFLMDCLKRSGSIKTTAKFQSFYDIGVDNIGIKSIKESGNLDPNRKDYKYYRTLYRLHPLEILIDEVDQNDEELGCQFLDRYKEGSFAMVNPPECIIMQSKTFQAMVKALATVYSEYEGFYNKDELQIINDHILESYFERDFKSVVKDKDDKWIKKPTWGREGFGIQVFDGYGVVGEKQFDDDAEIIKRNSNSYLYQRFVDSAPISMLVDSGRVNGYLTFSVFMLGNKASAIYCRFSEDIIAGTEAYWVPTLYGNKNDNILF
jgi:glutathionylspermidine synthase